MLFIKLSLLRNHLYLMTMLLKRMLTSLMTLLTFTSTLITAHSSSFSLLLAATDPFSTWLIWSSNKSSTSSVMDQTLRFNSSLPQPSSLMTIDSYIFCNRTRASYNHHGHHHRHYRDRCHHPFLYITSILHNYLLLFYYVSLFVLIISGFVNLAMANSLLQQQQQQTQDNNLITMNHHNLHLNNQSTEEHQVKKLNTNRLLSNITNPYIFKEHVCGSIDIRNTVAQFKRLENCTVVEGFLKIVLIDNGKPKDYENITFPKLREITDYFLLFRVGGLQSLAKMFPNLSVIRGRTLLHNYAFVIYEMLHLQEIGLKSLTNVVRGDIRIQKNPNLCFVDTIDWSRIARNFLISGNKDQNACPNCDESCPVVSARRNDGKDIGDSYNRVCWISEICQKHLCSSKCESMNRTCSQTGECCPEQCLGGCSADPLKPSSQICFSCKNFVYNNRCYDSCPDGSYAYYNRRCLTEDECHELSTNLSTKNQKYKFKAFMKECDYKCPVGYSEDLNDSKKCLKCEKTCPKICESTQINNMAQAQSLKGCTIINGSLEIYINNQGAQIVKELEENLKDLVEITGHLKIARSFPLITLNFLKNLRIIRGNSLERNSYSLLVFDNPNLQDLWTFQENEFPVKNEKFIKILRGHIFIHLNPKLCYHKIKSMIEYMDIPDLQLPWDERDISTHSNGDKVPCNVSILDVRIKRLASALIMLEFENFKNKMEDQRSLVGYLIYYREAKHRNVTIFDGRDACSNNEWTVIEYDTIDDHNNTYYDYIITDLKPYTQYALYIKTYTINTATKGAQSDIIYFKTMPDTPSQPLNLFAKAMKNDEIFVKWDPPSKPNGEVTHYNVRVTKEESSILHRDYCSENHPVKPLVIQKEPIINHHWLQNLTGTSSSMNLSSSLTSGSGNNLEKLDPSLPSSKQCCSCQKNDDTQKIRPNDVEQSITFEDTLLDIVYIKRLNSINITLEDDSRRKRRRHIVDFDNSTTVNVLFHNEKENDNDEEETYLSSTHIPQKPELTIKKSQEKWQFNKSVEKRLDILINDLEHYTEYTIEVRACQSPSDERQYCSVTAITSIKTLPLIGADDIDEQSISYSFIENNSTDNFKHVHIKWREPSFPNGFILSYHMEYKRVPQELLKSPQQICISPEHYKEYDGYLLGLPSGNYSVRLRARSLANYGNWTQMFHIFIEEPSNSNLKFVIITMIIILILLMITPVLYYKIRINQNKLDYMSVNPDYINSGLVYQPDPKWEIPRDKIVLIRELGEGSFGKVFEGEYTKNKLTTRCAVKKMNETIIQREQINFLKEADIMKSFTDCHHVVKLLGICSENQPFLVLMEIMDKGDLRNYLRNNRPDNQENLDPHPPTLSQIYKMAIEIADGMAYLASKKFVHRDLAARNCMLSEDLTVKIGDFGMTRDICESDYYRKGDKGLLPVRWMSPESLQDGIFTTYSDVWAYGVVLWEMVTLASQPYQGLSNEEVLKFVIDGNHMPKPENCPDVLWQMMLLCWNKKPKTRPTFIKVIQVLLEHVDKQAFLAVSFYKSPRSTFEEGKNSNEANSNHQGNNKNISLIPLNGSSNSGSESNNESSNDDSDDDQLDHHQIDEEDTNARLLPCRSISVYTEETIASNIVHGFPSDMKDSELNDARRMMKPVHKNNNSTNANDQTEILTNNSPLTKLPANQEQIKNFYESDKSSSAKVLNTDTTKNKKQEKESKHYLNLNASNRKNIINGHLIDTSMV